MATRRMSSHFGTDRILNLPCTVVDEILKYLPLRDAVRTSILSKGWRYKWLTLPYLDFGQSFNYGLYIDYKLESIMYQVLALHKGPILKFSYRVSVAINLHTLLLFLSRHPVEELILQLIYSSTLSSMPYYLFTFDQLKILKLVNCTLKAPSQFNEFGKLITLHLSGVRTAPGELTMFICKCPMLEQLVLNCCKVLDFEINVSNLKSFHFSGILNSICFKNTLTIEEVSISGYECHSPQQSQGCQSNLIKFFSSLSSITKLELSNKFLKFLARGGVTQKLPENLSNLIVLRLFDIVFEETDIVDCALCLIRSSPNLQIVGIDFCMTGGVVQEKSQGSKSYFIEFFSSLSSIKKLNLKCNFLVLPAGGGILQELPNNLSHLMVMQLSFIDFASIAAVSSVLWLLRSSPNLQNLEINSRNAHKGDMKPAIQFLREEQKFKLALGHLENVNVKFFSGSRPEMEFLKLVLLSATSLTKVELRISSIITPATKRESQMLKQLARLPRASSKVEIITY